MNPLLVRSLATALMAAMRVKPSGMTAQAVRTSPAPSVPGSMTTATLTVPVGRAVAPQTAEKSGRVLGRVASPGDATVNRQPSTEPSTARIVAGPTLAYVQLPVSPFQYDQ